MECHCPAVWNKYRYAFFCKPLVLLALQRQLRNLLYCENVVSCPARPSIQAQQCCAELAGRSAVVGTGRVACFALARSQHMVSGGCRNEMSERPDAPHSSSGDLTARCGSEHPWRNPVHTLSDGRHDCEGGAIERQLRRRSLPLWLWVLRGSCSRLAPASEGGPSISIVGGLKRKEKMPGRFAEGPRSPGFILPASAVSEQENYGGRRTANLCCIQGL